MTESQSYPFDFVTAPLFFDKYNINFSKSDFDGTARFQMVLASDCPDNIGDCLKSDGTLDSSVTVFSTGDIKLSLTEQSSDDDYTNVIEVAIAEDMEISLSSDANIKGVFLKMKSNNFILFFMIDINPMRYCDKICFEEGNVLLKVTR